MCCSFLSKASRCSIQQGREPLWGLVVCTLVCVCGTMHFRQPSILLFLRRKKGAVSSPIVSIQLAVITNGSLITEFIWLVENNGGSKLSFHSPCHQYCRLLCWRELNGACLWEMRRTRQNQCLASFFWTSWCPQTPEDIEPRGADKKEQRILERLTTWVSCRRRQMQSYIDFTIIMSTIQSCQIHRGLRAPLGGQCLWMAKATTIHKWSI